MGSGWRRSRPGAARGRCRFSARIVVSLYALLRLQHLLPLNPRPGPLSPDPPQYGCRHDQHQLAKLCRRNHAVVPVPDGRADVAHTRFRCHRIADRRSPGPRTDPIRRPDPGNSGWTPCRPTTCCCPDLCSPCSPVSQGMIPGISGAPHEGPACRGDPDASNRRGRSIGQLDRPDDQRDGHGGSAGRGTNDRPWSDGVAGSRCLKPTAAAATNANAAHPFENPTPLSNSSCSCSRSPSGAD